MLFIYYLFIYLDMNIDIDIDRYRLDQTQDDHIESYLYLPGTSGHQATGERTWEPWHAQRIDEKCQKHAVNSVYCTVHHLHHKNITVHALTQEARHAGT